MEQFNSLSEKTKLIEKALKYTSGDIEKAKAMAAGQHKDIHAVKCKFLCEEAGQSGFFYAFFNVVEDYIAHIDSVLSIDTNVFSKLRVFDPWKSFISDMKSIKSSDDYIDSQGFIEYILDSIISNDLFTQVHNQDLDDLTIQIKNILTQSFNTTDVQCQIDIEQTSSLDMEVAGIQIDLPGGSDENITKEGSGDSDAEDERIQKIEDEAQFVISGQVIVSPVKGKYVNDINVGEKIKVLLSRNNPISEKILTLLKAFDDDGNVLPIKGRLKEKLPLEKGGYILYALVAKGVLVKIIEEENVKIKMDGQAQAVEEEKKAGDNKLIIIMVVLIALVIGVGALLIQIL